MHFPPSLVSGLSSLVFLLGCTPASNYTNWPAYQGGKESNQYSSLNQINRDNIDQLQVAWTYATGDADTVDNRTQIQCNPLIIDGVLYGSSAGLRFFALDAATGEEKWVFDPPVEAQAGPAGVNRGLAYWADGREERLLLTASSFLFCLDAETGKPVPSFGANGRVDLHQGLGRDTEGLYLLSTSPGIVFQDMLILGGRVSESTGAAPGHIRAFNVRTGEQEWIFHTIPHPGEYGYET